MVRLVFLPFEESSYATFARSASGLSRLPFRTLVGRKHLIFSNLYVLNNCYLGE